HPSPLYALAAEKMRETGGPTDARGALYSKMVQNHELGHAALLNSYGFELAAMDVELRNVALSSSLEQLIESFCDLFVIERICQKAPWNPGRASEEFMIFLCVHRNDGNLPREKLIYHLLGAAASSEGNSLRIDFNRLSRLTRLLMARIHDYFSQIVFNVQSLVFGQEAPNPVRDRARHLTLRSVLTRRYMYQEKIKQHPITERNLGGYFTVQNALNRPDRLGRPFIVTFLENMGVYTAGVNEWVRRELGLEESSLPFKTVEFSGPLFKPDLDSERTRIDSAVSAAFNRPQLPRTKSPLLHQRFTTWRRTAMRAR
ncbi:MAG: hypothetical protein Q7S00_04850, partial [bacterium]|nr:hypothetical protein [bacterium]